MTDQSDSEVVDRIIRARRTSKLLKSPDEQGVAEHQWTAEHSQSLKTMLEVAAWAPFHRRADEQTHRLGILDSVVPWRFHVLERPACDSLLHYLRTQAEAFPDSRWSRAWPSKIKNLLAGCGVLVQATWLPDPSRDGSEPVLSENNIEHIAAAGAAIQNLLLAAEARGWRSYWSSGGVLRDEEIVDYLGIGRNEALLGSLFLSPTLADDVTVVEGGLRDQRGDISSFARWVSLPVD